MARTRRPRRFAGASVGVLVTAMIALGVGLTATGAAAGTSAVRPHQATGTITWAEAPQGAPSYIFPMAPGTAFLTTNLDLFQWLIDRPLFWFGAGSKVLLDPGGSYANAPTYSNNDHTVSFTMKGWKWSNGETVDAQDVMFWINMQKSVDRIGGWGDYSPGTFPDDVGSISVSGQTITMHLTGSVNPYWFTYNELSQITPLPVAWDVTSLTAKAGSGGCSSAPYSAITVSSSGAPSSTAAKDCAAVYDFLSTQSGINPVKGSNLTPPSPSTWPTSPIWSVVDGPWKLSSFNSTGNIVFVPNTAWSGPGKPTVAQFVLQYFTSDGAEFSSLLAGNTDIGYLPLADVKTAAPSFTTSGPNFPALAGNYTLYPLKLWEISYYNINHQANGLGGSEVNQPYIRQAMQSLVDQPLIIKSIDKNYAVPDYGPVPTYPLNDFVTKQELDNPWPFSPSTAAKLLSEHGWKINAGGTDVCESKGGCGTGIPKGSPLSIQLNYQSGVTAFAEQIAVEAEDWKSEGINVATKGMAFSTLFANSPPCTRGQSDCKWQITAAGGWLFSPDYYPTGEAIWETGAGSNLGHYSNSVADSLIKATDFSSNSSLFGKYENFLAAQVPDLWEPQVDQELYEVKDGITGVQPVNPLYILNPEDWHLKS